MTPDNKTINERALQLSYLSFPPFPPETTESVRGHTAKGNSDVVKLKVLRSVRSLEVLPSPSKRTIDD